MGRDRAKKGLFSTACKPSSTIQCWTKSKRVRCVSGLKGVTVVHREATDKLRECYTVRVGKRRVAEILVNAAYVRLNVDIAIPSSAIPKSAMTYEPKPGAKLVWAGGSFSITDEPSEAMGAHILAAAVEAGTTAIQARAFPEPGAADEHDPPSRLAASPLARPRASGPVLPGLRW